MFIFDISYKSLQQLSTMELNIYKIRIDFVQNCLNSKWNTYS